MAHIDYYTNPDEHGNYQYTTLSQVINNYILLRGDDDITKHEPRFRVLLQARRGLRELYYDVLRDIRVISLELSPTLSVTLPPDYINYVRISWVDEKGLLHPMALNNKISTAQTYLQDHNYEILYDDNGCVLTDEGEGDRTSLSNMENPKMYDSYCNQYVFCNTPFQPNRDMSKTYSNGSFNINSQLGIIQFSSDVKGKEVVLEYISDGLATGCDNATEDFKVHKFAETALLKFIYYELITQRANVPMNEKLRARKEYYNSKRIAKRRINTIRLDDLRQIFKGSSKWIK